MCVFLCVYFRSEKAAKNQQPTIHGSSRNSHQAQPQPNAVQRGVKAEGEHCWGVRSPRRGVTHTIIHLAPTTANRHLLFHNLMKTFGLFCITACLRWSPTCWNKTRNRAVSLFESVLCEPFATHMSSLLCARSRGEHDFGLPVSAATRPRQWPSLVLFPPRFELCVTLITLKWRTISCAHTLGTFYDWNCSTKCL